MIEDLAAQAKVFVGIIGAFVAAMIASAARQMYVPGGFRLKRWIIDLPFGITVGLVVGGLAEWVDAPIIVAYGASAAGGFLGPQWLDQWLRKKAESGDEHGGDDETRRGA